MSKENVILIDYDAPNDWEFHKAIEKATGKKWRVYKAVSNENHGVDFSMAAVLRTNFSFLF